MTLTTLMTYMTLLTMTADEVHDFDDFKKFIQMIYAFFSSSKTIQGILELESFQNLISQIFLANFILKTKKKYVEGLSSRKNREITHV